MKKIFAIVTLASLSVSAWSQTTLEALTFGQNHYYGTAKTIGMGNAVSAIGGDLGTIGINPAGSAVAGYSQFVISPGIALSATSSAYAPSYNYDLGSQTFGSSSTETKGGLMLPNMGISLRFETGNRTGLKSYTFGFVSNRTASYGNNIVGRGVEGMSSITGALAYYATGMPGNVLTSDQSMYNYGYSFNSLMAYDAGLINYNSDAEGDYYGSAESVTKQSDGTYIYQVPGDLTQNLTQIIRGSKNDVVMNVGFNYDDRFFLGFNLGIPTFTYKYAETIQETPVNSLEFPVVPQYYSNSSGEYVTGNQTYFEGARYGYDNRITGSGVYAKVGVIWLPTPSLRLAAAVQTPTSYTISNRWYVSGECFLEDASQEVGEISSPKSTSKYTYRSPYNVNLGLAYTFGTAGLLSVDYELTDYSVMKYGVSEGAYYYGSSDTYYNVNRLNKLFCGMSHSVRLGAEFRPMPLLALRAGYSIATSPERYYASSDGDVYAADYDYNFSDYESGRLTLGTKTAVKAPVSAISLGLGVQSTGSFFADFAIRRSSYPTQYYYPYSDYLSGIVSPCVKSTRKFWDAVITLGWRF